MENTTIGGYRVTSDIFRLENVVQQTGMLHGKNILIDVLRNIFAQDRVFKYVSDPFGFPYTPNHLGLEPDAGLDDEETTRIFIGGSYRYDVKFNPSIIIRNTGNQYVPISFNQNWLCTVNRKELIRDIYGNSSEIIVPAYSTLAGAWNQKFEVKVIAENEVDREEIADIVQVALMGSRRMELQNAGLFIKSMSTGGEQEVEYANDYLYMTSINLDTRTEWRINIPISNVCERIGLCVAFRTLDGRGSDALSINQLFTHEDLL